MPAALEVLNGAHVLLAAVLVARWAWEASTPTETYETESEAA